MRDSMTLGRVLFSSSNIFIVLAFYHLWSSDGTLIQYYYDDSSFYTAISTATGKDSSNNVFDCPWFCDRHLVSSPHAKGFFSSRLQYYANSTSCFQQIRLFISGDISLNPGPLTRSQSAKSKDISDRLYPILLGELSSFKGLKIGHLNVNGLLSKIHDVKVLLFALKLDVLAISETHLRCKTKDEDIYIPGYKIARRDRSDGRKGGGSLIYFSEVLNAYGSSDFSSNSCLEDTWIDLSFHSQRLLIGSIYRPPDCSSFFNEFPVVMENLWRKRSNIILLGDFNVNLSSSCDASLKRKFTNLLCKFNLKNVIVVPTRITGDSSSLIDLIITSVLSKISGHSACNPGISDHHQVYTSVNLRRISMKPKLKLVRDFKRVDIKALQHEFASAPWFI